MKNRSLYLLTAAAVISIPVVTTLLLVRFVLDSSIYQHVPAFSDELMYWRQALTFLHAGFDGGYYTVHEAAARAPFIHFYAHGPLYSVFFGSIGRITGWYLYSIPFFNMAFTTLALAVFTWLARLTFRQLVLVGLLVLTFWPMLIFLPSSMVENLHHSIAIVLALAFGFRLRRGKPMPRLLRLGTAGLIIVAALFRPPWAVMLMPLFWLDADPTVPRAKWKAVLWSLPLVAVLFLLTVYWTAPYHNIQARFTEALMAGDLLQAARIVVGNIVLNIVRSLLGNLLEVVFRGQVIFIVAAMMIAARSKPLTGFWRWLFRHTRPSTDEQVFYLFSLLPILLLNVVLYDVTFWKDYRLLSPYLLMVLMVLILQRHTRVVTLVVALNVLLLPSFVHAYHTLNHASYSVSQTTIDDARETFANALTPDLDSANSWCRTVLTKGLPVQTLGLPAEMGVSFYLDIEAFAQPPRSQYLLLETAEAETFTTVTGIALDRIASVDTLHLYRSADSDCPE